MVFESSYLMLIYFSNRNKLKKQKKEKRVRFKSDTSDIVSVVSDASTVKS